MAAAVWVLTPDESDQAAPQGLDDEAKAALREMRVPQADIDRMEAEHAAQRQAQADAAPPKPEEPDFEIWPWHVDALQVFDGMQTQWAVASGMERPLVLGLNYASAHTVMDGLGLDYDSQWREIYPQLRVMERAGRKHLNG